jgi:hypothetical protein
MRNRSLLLLAAITALAAHAMPARAQSVVSGYVFDSLRTKRNLVDAQVVIVELNRYAATDAGGHYRFAEPVPAGQWTITFLHPVLDSLLTAAPMLPLVVADSSPRTVNLATPSPASFVARVCPNTERVTGVMVGRVHDAGSDKPAAGVRVATDWAEVEFSSGTMRRISRATQTLSDANGNYVLCGIPTDISSEVHAEIDSTSTGPVEVFFGSSPVLRRDFLLNPRNALTAVLSGTVRNLRGDIAADATVVVGADLVTTRTDAQGHFAFAAAPAGTQIVTARLIGARPAAVSVDIIPGQANVADINLKTSAATQLPAVAITGQPPAKGRFAEFAERQRRGTGFYLTESDIARRGAIDLGDVLRFAPGLLATTQGSQTRYTMRGYKGDRCVPTYYVDGLRWFNLAGIGGNTDPMADIGSFVRPGDLRGVEVYRGLGSVPSQYDQANGCGVILFWTK